AAEPLPALPFSIDVTHMIAAPATAASGLTVRGALDAGLVVIWAVWSLLLLASLARAVRVAARRRAACRRETLGGVALRVSPDFGPAVVGVVAPEIVIPEWTLALDAPLRDLILCHEAEHRDAGDSRLLFGAAILLALFPWNPALWLQARRLRLAVEMDCDGRVLTRHDQPDRYGRLLITIAQQQSNLLGTFSPTLSEPVSHLERRIRAMMNSGRRWARIRAASFGLLGVAAVVVACAVHSPDRVTGPQPSANAQAAATPNLDGTFFPFQVDKPAMLGLGNTPPAYPQLLRAAGVSGEVIVQFVVEPTGSPDMSTFKVLKSTHELFTQSVRTAVAGFRYTPALVRGTPVRELIQEPFQFTLRGAGASPLKGDTAASAMAPARDSTHFVAFKVQQQAKLVPGAVLPRYPDILRAANVEGNVVAQFVVDTNGRADLSSFRVVRSTHELFTAAVKNAVASWSFTPAQADGRPVRQLYDVSVAFRTDSLGSLAPGTMGVLAARK
ncbi:MAG: M56 family metallopeptidase, partial [Gemmatimonadota bacterium]|nr:M56 family metallopeptidase [Gemmatimonadota bacterium]